MIQPIGEWLGALNLREAFTQQPALDENVLHALHACSNLLRNGHQLRRLEIIEVDRLIEQVDALSSEVLASTVNPALRRFLSEHLDRMRQALREYHLTGSVPLADVVKSAVGDFATTRPVDNSPQGRSLQRKVVAFFADLMFVVGAVQSTATFVGDAFEVLANVPEVLQRWELDPGPTPLELEAGDGGAAEDR